MCLQSCQFPLLTSTGGKDKTIGWTIQSVFEHSGQISCVVDPTVVDCMVVGSVVVTKNKIK